MAGGAGGEHSRPFKRCHKEAATIPLLWPARCSPLPRSLANSLANLAPSVDKADRALSVRFFGELRVVWTLAVCHDQS